VPDLSLPPKSPRKLGREPSAGSAADSDSQSREEGRAFLQGRVAALGALLSGIFSMFFVWRLISTFVVHDSPSGAYLPWQALTIVAFAGMWLVCRGRRRSEWFLRAGVFSGQTVIEVCAHHLHSIPPLPSERTENAIPSDLEQLIMRCLHKAPADRVQDARTMQRLLRSCRDAQSWSEEAARSWFATHGATLCARSAKSGVSGNTTLAVDLGMREHSDA